jgi:serine/threonine-protein kinase NIM1
MMTQTLFYNNEDLSTGAARKFSQNAAQHHTTNTTNSHHHNNNTGGNSTLNSSDNLSTLTSSSHKSSTDSQSMSLANHNTDHNPPPPAKLTAFEKLIENCRNNPEYRKEMTLNKLIGFYRIGSEVGSGNFSQVKLGLHLLTREKVAIKILNKTKLDEKTQRLLLREISSMQKISHPHIIRLYEVIHTQERLYICMEYAPDGELYSKISNEGKASERDAKIIFSQIVGAVAHMHRHHIIHRDIKAENIFFANTNPIIVKVGDFGFSIEANVDRKLNTYCGSPPYAAPE